jgi:collagenase-like PrtC family protease
MKIHRLISTTVAAVIMSGIAATALAAPDLTINIGANAVLFRENASVSVWVPGSGERWVSAVHLSADEIEAYQDDLPAENTVVAESGTITVELLPSGQWQISSGPDAKGKVNVTVFESDFAYAREYSWSVYGDPQ